MADTVIITGEKTVTVVTVGVQGPAGISGSSIPATNTTLGGIIVGDNLTITGNGVLSVADTFQPKTSCVTYGLTDTLLPSGPNTFYVRGEHVVQSGRNFYSGLRGRKTSAGSYLSSPITYGIGGYNVDANGTPTGLSSIETSASVIILSSADSTDPISASTATLNSAGTLTLATSNGVTGGSCSVFLDDGTVTVSAGASGARVQLAGSNGTLGVGFNDFTFRVGSDSFSKGVSIKRQSLVTSVALIYSVSNATAAFNFDSGLFFYDGDPLSAATELQHKYTNTFSNTTSSTKIRLVRNNAELSFAEMSQVKTTNSILTQGYADTRYQAVGAYLTSANLTYANLTGTPTTLAGYGITDGLTSANLTPYLTISSANSTYSVLGHTHAIANVTGLQTALDAKLPSANFTYANLTGKPTTLAGYGITDGLTSANLTPYLTIASATATYAVLGHTHSIANVTGLQTALDAKLPSANFTYANLTGTPNLTVYLTTANASTTYQPLGNYATTSCLTFSNITGKPTTLSGYGITDGLTSANLTPYLTTANATATYSVLGHTHSIANVTGLQTALDAKLPSANFTYANITGKPTFATVATSGSYTDLSNTPTAYSLPTATNATLGGIKVGANLSIANGVLSAISSGSSATSLPWSNITSTPTTLAGYGITDGLTASNLTAYLTSATAASTYLPIANFTYANITGKPTLATVATTGSYTDLTNTPASYSLPTASTTVLGGVKVDGTSIVINSGVISSTYSYSLPAATTSTLGGVRLGVGVGLDANGFLTTDVKLTTNTFTGTQNLGGNLLTQPKLQAYRETSTAPTISAGSLTLDLSGSNFFAVSLNAAISTITISNIPSSSVSSFTLEFTGTGTTYSVNWTLSSGVIKWAGAASAPTITATTGKKDVFCFYTTDGGSNWLGFIGGQNY